MHVRRRPTRPVSGFFLVVAALCAVAPGCGGNSTPPQAPTTEPEPSGAGPSANADIRTATGDASDAGSPTRLSPTAPPVAGSASEPGRSLDDIRAMVMARRDEARACYDKVQKDKPDLKGDLVVKWVIDPKGNVTEPAVDDTRSSLIDTVVGKCVVGVIAKLKFRESGKGLETRATYPFNFNPKTFPKADAGTTP
jgi:hypothetical protein